MSARNRWVTFDCFDTLVDRQAWLRAALAPLAGDDTNELQRAYLANERRVEREYPIRPYKDVLVTALVRAADELRLPISASDARVLPAAWASMRLFDDVEIMLAELRLKGWQLGVLTNCDDDLFEMTHRAFTRPFDLFVTSERVRSFKPARWHFRAFELMTGVARQDWVHVGTSAYRDIAPARDFGLNHIWIDRRGRAGARGFSSLRVGSRAEVSHAIDGLLESDPVAEPALQ